MEYQEGEKPVMSVAECVSLLQEAVSRLGFVQVRGEISGTRIVRESMAFFDLKDSDTGEHLIRCKVFGWQFSRGRHLLEDGMEVILTGKFDIYAKTGDMQLRVNEVSPYGEGAFKRAFEVLKKRLSEQGYFDEERKREIPAHVQRIGLITSEEGMAVTDFRQHLGDHGFKVYLSPVWVEGEKTEGSVVNAIKWFNKRMPDVDVVVVIRGGGGFENLRFFNSEKIADAIFLSRIPVITGIGHTEDESIADLVADLRCNTPTQAAVHLRNSREEIIRGVDMREDSLVRNVEGLFEDHHRELDTSLERMDNSLSMLMAQERAKVSRMAEVLQGSLRSLFDGYAKIERSFFGAMHSFEASLVDSVNRVNRADSLLSSLSPEHVLKRGYSLVRDSNGGILRDVNQVKEGDDIDVRLSKGELKTKVTKKIKGKYA